MYIWARTWPADPPLSAVFGPGSYSDCDKTLAANFDFDDGVWDNTAKAIAGMNDRCLAIDQQPITDAIDQMRESGCEVNTDGISADKDGKAGRRLQVGYAGSAACSLASFDARLAEINAGCCADDANCPAGVPTTCDFECAIVWNPFVTECEMIIAVMMPGNIDDFETVTRTCNALPRSPLISAIVESIASTCGDCTVPDTLATTHALQCNLANTGDDNDEGAPVWPTLETEPSCPLSSFAIRLAIVNAACCAAEDDCGKAGPTSCSKLECAVQLVPFYAICRKTIDKIFDHADGTDDGNADSFAKLVDDCDRMDPEVPKERLHTLIGDEHCDVNTTSIFATVSVVEQPTTGKDYGGGKRRQAQMVGMISSNSIVGACSLDAFNSRIADVDQFCCDPNDPSDNCGPVEGPPEACDFECSGVWLPLWNDCQPLLQMLFAASPDAVQQFGALAAACEAPPPP